MKKVESLRVCWANRKMMQKHWYALPFAT